MHRASGQSASNLPPFHFRSKDYQHIKAWHRNCLNHHTHSQQPTASSVHHRLILKQIDLTPHYLNTHLPTLNHLQNISVVVWLSRDEEIASMEHAPNLPGSLNANQIGVGLEYFCWVGRGRVELGVQVQIATPQGMLRMGIGRVSLKQQVISGNGIFNLPLTNNRQQTFDISTGQAVRLKDCEEDVVGLMEIEWNHQRLEEIQKFVPSCTLIGPTNHPPTINMLRLKRKKDSMTTIPCYKIAVNQMLMKVKNQQSLQHSILRNNPFTWVHLSMVQLLSVTYTLKIGTHNGWQYHPDSKGKQIDFIAPKQTETYLSYNQEQHWQMEYYEGDLVMLAQLHCEAKYKLTGVTGQERMEQFLVGWLPLAVDLAAQTSRIQMKMVSDMQLPCCALKPIPSEVTFSCVVQHKAHKLYQDKHDRQQIYTHHLLPNMDNGLVESTPFLSWQQIRQQRTLSTQENTHRLSQAEDEISNMTALIQEEEKKRNRQKRVRIRGRGELGRSKPKQQLPQPDMEGFIGKSIQCTISLNSLIPQTNLPSQHYLPTHLTFHFHLLRTTLTVHSTLESQAQYHLPLHLKHQPLRVNYHLSTKKEYEQVVGSRVVIVGEDQESGKVWAKGNLAMKTLMSRVNNEACEEVALECWIDGRWTIWGRVLLNLFLTIEQARKKKAVDEFDLNGQLHNLTRQQRLRLRISNFKGQTDTRAECIAIVKQGRKHNTISKIVEQNQGSQYEIQYTLCHPSYLLIPFRNNESSSHNNFRVFLDCPFARLVTDGKEFQQVVEREVLDRMSFLKMDEVWETNNHTAPTHYQCALNFNQQIGIMIRVVMEQEMSHPTRNLTVKITRNTLPVSKIGIKLKYRPPIIWDYIQRYDLMQGDKTQIIQVGDQVNKHYTNLTAVSSHARVVERQGQKFLNLQGLGKGRHRIYLTGRPLGSDSMVLIQYHLTLLQGSELQVVIGQPLTQTPHTPSTETHPIQLLRSHSKQLNLPHPLHLHGYPTPSLLLLVHRHTLRQPLLLTLHDLTGDQISSHLYMVTSHVSAGAKHMTIHQSHNIRFSFLVQNPYPSRCKLTLGCSSQLVGLDKEECDLDGYGSEAVWVKIEEWGELEKEVYLTVLDEERGVIVQTLVVKHDPNHQ